VIEAQLLEVNAGGRVGAPRPRGSGHRRAAFLAVIAILAAIPQKPILRPTFCAALAKDGEMWYTARR
jgi:hypothetical protein